MKKTYSFYIKLLAAIIFNSSNLLLTTAHAIEFNLPLNCDYGNDCFIQNYVNLNKSGTPLDYKCNPFTYKDHSGTDFRLRDYLQMVQGVAIVASADGIVKSIRDGEKDFAFNEDGAKAIAGKECGNGVLIEHTDNYSSQYCHLLQNSINVKKGQLIKQGEFIGLVGMSGKTMFPHLHLTIRHNAKILDPFTNLEPRENFSCKQATSSTANTLWNHKTINKLKYLDAAILNFHLSDQIPQPDKAQHSYFRENKLTPNSKRLILWAELIHLKKNDKVLFKVTKDEKILFQFEQTVKKDYSQFFVYAGKNLKKLNLQPGTYTASFELHRNDNKILARSKSFEVIE